MLWVSQSWCWRRVLPHLDSCSFKLCQAWWQVPPAIPSHSLCPCLILTLRMLFSVEVSSMPVLLRSAEFLHPCPAEKCLPVPWHTKCMCKVDLGSYPDSHISEDSELYCIVPSSILTLLLGKKCVDKITNNTCLVVCPF